MIRGSLARRYAKALLSLAEEKNLAERIREELKALTQILEESDELRLALQAPVLVKETRDKVLESLAESAGFHELTLRFLKLLNQKGRLRWLQAIAETYENLFDEAAGRVKAEVIAAAPLSEQEREKLLDALRKFTGKEVVMELQVDESLLGGVVTRVAGTLLDGSVRTQLKSMEELLKTGGELSA